MLNDPTPWSKNSKGRRKKGGPPAYANPPSTFPLVRGGGGGEKSSPYPSLSPLYQSGGEKKRGRDSTFSFPGKKRGEKSSRDLDRLLFLPHKGPEILLFSSLTYLRS